ncbi:MAG: LytTR family DNA-binding domain-containing protein [Spirochaetales bacterium]|nr:LytTR family DNA-binding domain-containing protein [Spirochaetales bacterium]
MRAVIVDDESLARDELRFLLEERGAVKVIGEGENGLEAVRLARELKPDIMFLDIQMPGKNGIEAAREILKMEHPPRIIFQTAYDEYALQAFEVNALDYLVKPLSPKRLEAALNRVEKNRPPTEELYRILEKLSRPEEKEHKTVPLYRGEKIIPLKQENIIFVEARGKQVRVVTTRGEFTDQRLFWQFEELLTRKDFFRCHRSYLINLSFLEEVNYWVNNAYVVKLRGTEEKIPVSRSHVGEFRDRMNL